MIMLKNKNYLYLLFIVKYALILTITPELENQRFYEFFNSCSGFCLNPYENIQDMYTGSLSFPYGYVMYFFFSIIYTLLCRSFQLIYSRRSHELLGLHDILSGLIKSCK